ncbi:DUF2634 domain-containing protein [Fictibacillus gelatini]|uniref:DUF2634 domain-containing protein n=1 Tax=Fictibacillus gelatini TaxID=225985 RepID=UPI0004227614|nr:DUF2634 domain-containing protein [Fictibacillus gelatini]
MNIFSPKIVDGDIVIENGDIAMIEGDEELAQSVRMLLQTRKGEFFLEEDHGLVFDHILGKDFNLDEARDDIIEAISQEDRIASVEEIAFNDDLQSRTRTISLTLKKDDGETLSVEGVEIDG